MGGGERRDGLPAGSYRNILRAGFVEHGLRRHLVASADIARIAGTRGAAERVVALALGGR